MPLHLNISNSLGVLAKNLAEELRVPSDVFLPQYIVTQTAGMNSWLKLQIAASNGIAANILYVNPNDVIQKIYFALGGKRPNMLSAQNLRWLLYHILGEKQFVSRFAHIADYFQAQPNADLKRMALAEKTADLFDQYQIYRPEWIENWNNDSLQTFTADKWQQYLWLRAKQLSNDRLPDKTVIATYIKQALSKPEGRQMLRSMLPDLHVFGLSIITGYHLNILYNIAEVINVRFHIVNPAPAVYWFEDRSPKQLAVLQQKGVSDIQSFSGGNTLLSNWGRIIQDTFMMLFSNEELLNNLNELDTEEPPCNTLLHKIQNDIFNGYAIDQRAAIDVSDLSDGSLTISSCFTIAREVEVLYNYLVHLVAGKKEQLSPRDIVVMVTDINAYAPYIKAIFKNAPYYFNFTIADETYTNGDSIITALTALFSVSEHSFKAEQVLQLLDSSYIRKRFGITNHTLIRQVVSAANIRFGIEGNQHDDTRFVSWAYGIKRIMFGICISGGQPFTDRGGEIVYPLDLIEGSDALELVRFAHFIKVLVHSIDERNQPKTIAAWIEYVERTIQNMICDPEEETGEDYLLLQDQLSRFNVADEFLHDELSFEVFSHSLLQSVSGVARSGSFAGGGITFCSLIPMRSIPFKVVALLGLNFNNFPRRETAPSFSLIENDQRRRGDRNVKENDKHLFLETICSAKDYVYISYIGQSVKDNSPMPPSALVDELLDYIEEQCAEPSSVRASLVVRQPLHSFSQNKHDKAWPNFLNHSQAVVPDIITENPVEQLPDFSEISLDALVAFFKHPMRAYYNKVLNIRYGDHTVLLPEAEIFELDDLQKYQVKMMLLQTPDNDLPALQHQLKINGQLPLKNVASVELNKLQLEVAATRQLFQQTVSEQQESRTSVTIELANTTIAATVRNLYGSRLVFVSFSKSERALFEAYLTLLVATAAGMPVQLYYISHQKQAFFKAAELTRLQARNTLEKLLHLYKTGHQQILAFQPDYKISPKAIDAFNNDVLAKIIKEIFHSQHACTDPYLVDQYNSGYYRSETIAEEIRENADIIIKPLAQVFPGFYT